MNQNADRTQTFSVSPIGFVQASDQDGRYGIKVLPVYTAAMKGLEGFSHVVIVWWANRHDHPKERQTLTTSLPYAPGVQAGVFACRSEYRPNPIAITVMPILTIDPHEGMITLPWIDAFDGTPVLDLKPYMPVSDRVRDVKVADWLSEWPLWMEDAGAYFASHETNFGD